MPPPAILRGDIFYVNLDPTEGHEEKKNRPCVVISRDSINRSAGVIVVVPLTSKNLDRADLKHRVLINEQEKLQEAGTSGCPGDSLALVYQLRAIDPKERISDEKRLAHITATALGKIEAALIHVLDIY